MNEDRSNSSRPDEANAEAEAFLDYLEEAVAEMPPVAPPTGAIVLYGLIVPGLVLQYVYIKRARKILDQQYPRNG